MSEEYTGEMLIYRTGDGQARIECRLADETLWLNQASISELFDTTKQNVSLHVQNVLEDGELVEGSVVKESLTTASDGKRYRVKYYNLDMVIAIGYRVRSKRGTQFRQKKFSGSERTPGRPIWA